MRVHGLTVLLLAASIGCGPGQTSSTNAEVDTTDGGDGDPGDGDGDPGDGDGDPGDGDPGDGDGDPGDGDPGDGDGDPGDGDPGDGDGDPSECDRDPYEPNDTVETASPLEWMPFGNDRYRYLSQEALLCPGEEDWFLLPPWMPFDFGVPYEMNFVFGIHYQDVTVEFYDAQTMELVDSFIEPPEVLGQLSLDPFPGLYLRLRLTDDQLEPQNYQVNGFFGQDLFQ